MTLTSEPIILEQRVTAGSQSIWAGVQGLALRAIEGSGPLISRSAHPGDSETAVWSQAQAELAGATVLRPKATLGLKLEKLETDVVPCGDESALQLMATYTSTDGREMTIYEGTPYFCGDMGDGGETESRAMIRGVNGYVYDGGPGGRLWAGWKDSTGPVVQVVSGNSSEGDPAISRSDIMRVAYSMTTVPAKPGVEPLEERPPPESGSPPESDPTPPDDPVEDSAPATQVDWESFSESNASSIFHPELSGAARLRAMALDMALILNRRAAATDRCMRTESCSASDIEAQMAVARGFARAMDSVTSSERQSATFCYSAIAQLANLATAFGTLAGAGPLVWRLDLSRLQQELVRIANDAGRTCT